MKPTVGRIVHYTGLSDAEYPSEAKAAIITKVVGRDLGQRSDEHDFDVHLAVFYSRCLFFIEKPVPYWKEPMKRGHWNWPPR